MSRVNSKPAEVLVSAVLLQPVQTATERHEPGTLVNWPQAQVEALVANCSASILTADEMAVVAAEAKAEAKAEAGAEAEAAAAAAADAAALSGAQAPAGDSLL